MVVGSDDLISAGISKFINSKSQLSVPPDRFYADQGYIYYESSQRIVPKFGLYQCSGSTVALQSKLCDAPDSGDYNQLAIEFFDLGDRNQKFRSELYFDREQNLVGCFSTCFISNFSIATSPLFAIGSKRRYFEQCFEFRLIFQAFIGDRLMFSSQYCRKAIVYIQSFSQSQGKNLITIIYNLFHLVLVKILSGGFKTNAICYLKT